MSLAPTMPETGKTAMVTGAGGFIGSLLVRRLAEAGYRVLALSHRAAPQTESGDVEWYTGDVRDEVLVRKLTREADAVFHLAATVHETDSRRSSYTEYRSVNLSATEALVGCAAGRRRAFVFASTVAVYGPGRRGVEFDEESPLIPSGPYAETKAQAEKAVLSHPGTMVLRFPGVYGRGMKGNLPRLADAVRHGWYLPVGPGLNRKTLVHVEDAVGAMILCAESSSPAGRIFNVTDGGIHTLKEIVDAISAAMGKSPPRFRVPESLARAAFGTADLLLRTVRSDRRLIPLLEKLTEDSAISGARIQEELGFEPKFGLAEGWRDAVGR